MIEEEGEKERKREREREGGSGQVRSVYRRVDGMTWPLFLRGAFLVQAEGQARVLWCCVTAA